MKKFKLLPVPALVLGVFAANAFAQTDAVVLDTINVTNHQGLKVKTNVVTTQIKDESTETDLRGLLKNEPSIAIGGGNGTSQYLYIRGMGQNSIDVKVDNAYSDAQIHYHQGRHMLDPAMVKIVSVQKGAGSASAGIGQTNGAIVAKTLDALDLLEGSDKNFGARVGTGFSTNYSQNYNATVYGRSGMFDGIIATNFIKDGNYKAGKGYYDSVNKSDRVLYSGLNKLSYLAKVGATVGDHRFVLSHLHEQHKGDRLVREEFFNFDPSKQAPAARKMTVDNTNLEWTGKNLGFAKEAQANVYRLVHGRWSANDKGNGYAGNKEGETSIKVVTHGANFNFDLPIHHNILVKYGINYRHQEAKPHFKAAGISNQRKSDTGFYVEAITAATDSITLTTGLRYDQFTFKAMDRKKVSDSSFNPSIGVIFEATPELSFSASHNYATRSPRMQDAILSHGNKRGLTSILEGTKAEQARTTEIGFNYDNGTFSIDGSYFWQRIKDALGTTAGRDNHMSDGTWQSILNAGKIKNHGYELNFGYHQGGFTARLGVADSKPRFYANLGKKANKEKKIEENKPLLSGNPEYASAIGRTWTASVSYRFEQPNIEVGLHHRLVEKVKAKDDFFLTGGNVTPGKGKAGYNVTDLTVNWKPFNDDRMNVNFAIDNIANKFYKSHAQRSNDNTLPARGREFRLGVNYTF
ncbi:TonB-dependent receptor domain-containing protein [Actinobacillus seminis]|uniref:TonB-dependent receptor domain-containing protein n=1 Tax=Actinobacillus seminis TaxID=722 RepID=UPI003B95AC92